MSKKEEIRREMRNLDREIVNRLDRRAELAKEISLLNQGAEHNDADLSEMRSLIDEAIQSSLGVFPQNGLSRIFTEVLSQCNQLERPLSVAYLGPDGTFTHQAALTAFGSAARFVPLATPDDLFDAVEKKQVDFSCVAIENSTGGVVHSVLDRFLNSDVKINSELILYVHHCLISNIPMNKIKRIFSHPQPFLQCRKWLRTNLPEAQLIEVSSTVEGVHRAKASEDGAAISSELAANLNGMNILAKDIQDTLENFTRFVIIGRRESAPTGEDKTSLILSIKHRPGSLFEALQPFSSRFINMTKIESRPTRQRPWEYVFFIDFDGHENDRKVQDLLDELKRATLFIKSLGSYPRARNYEA